MSTARPGATHAVLGAGGVGLLVGAALARAGRDVVLLLRGETLAAYEGIVRVESRVLGDFEVTVRADATLAEPVDVLWVTTKAPALEAALEVAPPEHAGLVVPLLNGLEHIATLRRRYAHVVPATVSVESERVAPGRVRQRSLFLRARFAPGGEVPAQELRAAGIDASIGAGEAEVLWGKLAFLAPLALATAAADAPFGAVRSDERRRALYERCRDEVCAVAAAAEAPQDAGALEELAAAAAYEMRSSLQKDVAAGRPDELDAIGGAVVRAAHRHGVPVPATEELVEAVAARRRATLAGGGR